MSYDTITKEAVKTITEDIAIYFLKLNISNIEFVDKELQRVEKREADIVALCNIDNKESILHIELQNTNDLDMNKRMLRYYTDISLRFKDIDIFQYVIYTGKDRLKMKDNINTTNLNYKYTILDMKTIDCEEMIKLNTPDAIVLSILCDFKDKDEKEILAFLMKKIKELVGEDLNSLRKYMLMLEKLSENRNLKDKLKEVEEMLRVIELEKLPSYELGIERGIERGRFEGLTQGIQKGTIQKAIEIAKNLLDVLDVKTISLKTGLSIEEINKLKDEMKD